MSSVTAFQNEPGLSDHEAGSDMSSVAPNAIVVVFGGSHGAAQDYVRHLTEHRPDCIALLSSESAGHRRGSSQTSVNSELVRDLTRSGCPLHAVVFAGSESDAESLSLVRRVLSLANQNPVGRMLILTSSQVHYGDAHYADLERCIIAAVRSRVASLTILRTGFILSRSSWLGRSHPTLRWLTPCLSPSLTGTFVGEQRLNEVLDQEFATPQLDSVRTISLLGERRAWACVLRNCTGDHGEGLAALSLRMMTLLCRWIGLQFVVSLVLALTARYFPAARPLVQSTLQPTSNAELLSLCNRHNARHVRIAGYNNGVNHFGWHFPQKTVVQTTGIRTTPRIRNGAVRVGSGRTLKDCIQALNKTGQELFVVPNYSYISVGTAFFVPVHGSGCDVSTLGDTIDHVLLYDTEREQFIRARRGEPAFQDAMYHRSGRHILLRLVLRVRPKAQYLMTRTTLLQPTHQQLLDALHCPTASNVEIRKNKVSSNEVTVCSYRVRSNETTSADSIEVPRDSIGRVWDRMEENRIAAALFHWFVRSHGFHVELFLTPDEMAVFWNHHTSLPISKLQFRLVRRDGMTHSPFRDEDLVSVDLFTTRKHQAALTEFLRVRLPRVRTNPGKQTL